MWCHHTPNSQKWFALVCLYICAYEDVCEYHFMLLISNQLLRIYTMWSPGSFAIIVITNMTLEWVVLEHIDPMLLWKYLPFCDRGASWLLTMWKSISQSHLVSVFKVDDEGHRSSVPFFLFNMGLCGWNFTIFRTAPFAHISSWHYSLSHYID